MNISSFSFPFSLPTLGRFAAFILFILLVWFAGPYIKFADYTPLASISARILFIVTALLLLCLIWFIKRYDIKAIWQQFTQRIKEKERDKKQKREKSIDYVRHEAPVESARSNRSTNR